MTMRRNVIIASMGAALVAGIVTASAVAGATSAVTKHTINLVSIQIASHQFSRSTAAQADVDRHRGKVIGYDVLSEKFTSTGGVIRGSYAPPGGGNLYFEIPRPVLPTPRRCTARSPAVRAGSPEPRGRSRRPR